MKRALQTGTSSEGKNLGDAHQNTVAADRNSSRPLGKGKALDEKQRGAARIRRSARREGMPRAGTLGGCPCF